MIAHITRRILNIWCGNDGFFFFIELRTVLSQEWTNTSVGNGLQNYGFFKKTHIKSCSEQKMLHAPALGWALSAGGIASLNGIFFICIGIMCD